MSKKTSNKELTTQIITDNVLNFISYMPNPDDVASGTFDSYSTYRKMKTDPRISSLLLKLKNISLNFPCHIEQGNADEKVYDFVKNLDIFKNMQKKAKRMLSALDYGFSVSELVWRIENGIYIPETFITRKPERFYFNKKWELFLNTVGARTILDQDYKWLIFQHDPDDENPYGTSVMRCVYWAWMFKQAGYDFWLQATEKFSVKSLVALFQADGNEDTIRNRATQIAQMLMGVTSGSTAAVGNVQSIQDIGMTGDLSHFKELVEACDVQISYGLTGQSIATATTNGGSLALGEVQADLLYEDCKGIALELQSVLQKIIDWTVELNYGKEAKVPQIVFDVEKRATFDQVMKAIEKKIPVSKSSLYSYYGLPEPKDEKDTFLLEDTPVMLSDSETPKTLKKNFSFF